MEQRHSSFIAALLVAPSIVEAARAVRISEATARRWIKLPDVAEAYRAARRATVDHALAQVQALTMEAADALRRNLTCGIPHAEIRAATAILEIARDSIEIGDFLARLEAVEASVSEERQSA